MTIKSETKIASRKGCDIILQELENDRYASHCVQYAGNGKYFKTLEEAKAYIYKRWHLAVHELLNGESTPDCSERGDNNAESDI